MQMVQPLNCLISTLISIRIHLVFAIPLMKHTGAANESGSLELEISQLLCEVCPHENNLLTLRQKK